MGAYMKKVTLSIVLISLVAVTFLFAQETVEEMMRKMQEETQQMMQADQKAVADYIAEQDAAFAKFLEEDWKMFQSFVSENQYEKPKPTKLPVAEVKPESEYKGPEAEALAIPEPPSPEAPDLTIEKEAPKIAEKAPAPVTDSYGVVEPAQPVKESPTPRVTETAVMDFAFFDAVLKFEFDRRFLSIQLESINNQAISKYWESMSATDFDRFLYQISRYSMKMRINDWGYSLMIYQIGKQIYGGDENMANLFTWFMLSKSGYNIKVAYDENYTYLLIPTQNKLYATPYITIDGQRYYITSFEQRKQKMGALYTYRGEYPGADQIVSLDIKDSPVFKNAVSERDLKFTYAGTPYSIPVKFSNDAVNYFQYYPQTNYEVYFGAKVAPLANYSLLKQLTAIIDGKTEAEAVNILLRFVQTAFEYKTDGEYFGREKPMFVEETIFYPYSDCEDRSVLFAHLVKNLLGLDVVGLNFPGHMATAVKFHSDIQGDAVRYEGMTYVICDPTYINASIGQCMPQFKDIAPRVIKIG